MPRFRDADGRNDVTLFKILLDPPLSNEVARGEKKMKGKEKRKKRKKGKGENDEEREERERERRGSRSYCNNMEVCHEFDESSKKIVQPTRKSTPLLLLSIVSSRRCFCQISIFL